MKQKIIRATTVPSTLDVFCDGLLAALSERYEVIALSSPDPELEVVAQREQVRTIAVPMERHISLKRDLTALYRLIKVFRRERPTMVHSMTPKAGLLCMIAAWLTRVPVRVHTFTGLVFPTSSGIQRRILMLTDAMTCACATHVIPEGEGVKHDLLRFGITRKPLKVLGYGNIRGVDMHHYDRRPEVMALTEPLRQPGVFTFLYIGRFVRDKGIEELTVAFARLHEQYPNIRLLLVGRFEETLDPLSEKASQLINTHPVISTTGWKSGDALLAYYAASDCYVLPSYREGFPNTVLEAGAMGLPCIVTDINGSREIISHGENGLIVPPKDAEALYQAMREMIANVVTREAMASKARKMVGDRFEQGFVRQFLYDFYDEILNHVH